MKRLIPFGKPDNHFVFVAKPGPITSFIYYTERDKQILWQKGNEQPVSNAAMFLGFKKNVLKLVGDNADLAGKIERKETGYGMLGLVTIIDEYNAWVAAKQ